MCVTHENSDCVLNLMLSWLTDVSISQSLQYGHASSSQLGTKWWSLGGGGQADAHQDSAITFIYTTLCIL